MDGLLRNLAPAGLDHEVIGLGASMHEKCVRSWATVILALALLLAGLFNPCRADPPQQDPQSVEPLKQLSLEELGNVEVTTVSKNPQRVLRTPAAIFVITQEDIRRSGATSIPDALRLAPGVQVARIDADHWSVSIRGFAGQFSKSLLVLIDGRSVYTPLYEGVYWNIQNVMLDDVERIEVIRGPGGTIWGANAVNGVINIITKSAEDTQGTLATLGGGNVDQGTGAIRYGGSVGKDFTIASTVWVLSAARNFTPTALDSTTTGSGRWVSMPSGRKTNRTPSPFKAIFTVRTTERGLSLGLVFSACPDDAGRHGVLLRRQSAGTLAAHDRRLRHTDSRILRPDQRAETSKSARCEIHLMLTLSSMRTSWRSRVDLGLGGKGKPKQFHSDVARGKFYAAKADRHYLQRLRAVRIADRARQAHADGGNQAGAQ